MKNKIIKLARRLDNFTVQEIIPYLQADINEIEPIINELVNENLLQENSDSYFYKKNKTPVKRQETPLFFNFHPQEEIEFIVRCFCANIEVEKVTMLIPPKRNCISKFYKYFRDLIYKTQYDELITEYSNLPKEAREREYFDKTIYLYLYNNKLFVSKHSLKSKNAVPVKREELLEIKNIYLRSKRKVLSCAYAHFYHIHLAEELWRDRKNFEELYINVMNLIGIEPTFY